MKKILVVCFTIMGCQTPRKLEVLCRCEPVVIFDCPVEEEYPF